MTVSQHVFHGFQEVGFPGDGVGVCLAGNDGFHTADLGIAVGVGRIDSLGNQGGNHHAVVEKEGDALLHAPHHLQRPAQEGLFGGGGIAHRKATDESQGFGYVQHQVGKIVDLAGAVGGGTSDAGLLYVIIPVELDPKEAQKLEGFFPGEPAAFQVGGVVGEENLIHPTDGVGVDGILEGVDDVGKP